jgi:hypothetical protein
MIQRPRHVRLQMRAATAVRLVAYLFFLALIVSACSIFGESSGGFGMSTSETVGPDNTFVVFDGDPLPRQVRITFPPGGLENARPGAAFGVNVSTRSAEPFPDVEFVIGDPIDDRVVVENMGNLGWDWELALPEDCERGCEIVIPVTIEQTGEGEPPRFVWSASFRFDYVSDELIPAAADAITMVIEPADSE